jgi:ribosomal-protein-alanine N-acetyltransferase
VLRPLGVADLSWLHALNSEPGVRRFLFDDLIWTMEETQQRLLDENDRMWREEGRGLFAVCLDAGQRPVGWVGYWYFHEPPVLEIGYALHPDVWGQGLAVEAALAVMDWGVSALGDTEFRASTDAPNVASIRVLEKLGFSEARRSPGPRAETVHFWRPA